MYIAIWIFWTLALLGLLATGLGVYAGHASESSYDIGAGMASLFFMAAGLGTTMVSLIVLAILIWKWSQS